VQLKESIMLDRRRFLVGAAGLLTASFVRKASAFSRSYGEPLLLPTDGNPEKTLCVYRQDWKDYETNDYAAKWRVSLGPNQPFAPPPPTRRERLCSLGYPLKTQEDIERACIQEGLEPQDLDNPLDGFGWEDAWDNFTSPQAKAFHLLKNLDLGDANSKLRQAGEIIFEEFGGGNGSSWVELKDDLTVSLLQARLIEVNLPIDVDICGSLGASA
jgi:hypothetical protein